MIRRAGHWLMVFFVAFLYLALCAELEAQNERAEIEARAEQDQAERWRVLDQRGREMVEYNRMKPQ